jgi:hypothetical protein
VEVSEPVGQGLCNHQLSTGGFIHSDLSGCIKTSTCGSAKAEMNAINHAIDQSIYIQKLLSSVGIGQGQPYKIYNNNQGAIAIVSSGPTDFHGAQKHFDLKLKQLIEIVNTGLLQLDYMPTEGTQTNSYTSTH